MRAVFLAFFLLTNGAGYAQNDTISTERLGTFLQFLASDSMKGRGNYSPALRQAADFIADHFKRAGLDSFRGGVGYFFPVDKEYFKKEAFEQKSPLVLLNVVAVLPGKSRPSEIVMFSAHYDHIGISEGRIFNGANDNASGTSALLMLAEYFAKRGDNERTLMFCAFSGEEMGMLGSQQFARDIDPKAVVAAINMEMIGMTTIGKNAFFITGAHHSDMKKIFERNLGKTFRVRKEPDYEKMLFHRSDNIPFARLGIPAHTVMSSDDDDPCYHQPCDDVKVLNLENMTAIVKAIAKGASSIISGKDTPRRIDPSKVSED